MTEPIDTAAFRLSWGGSDFRAWPDRFEARDVIIALCDALDAARAELKACHGNPVAGNPGEWPHVDQIEGLSTQAAKWYRAQPVVEAAVALAGVMWYPALSMEPKEKLLAAVAAYQAGEKP